VTGVMLLLSQAVLYFGVMAALFRARGPLGLGVFVCALGVMHFLETYLAAVFFIELPFGLISPGSTVLFSGKLLMVLLLYIKEDAEVVRQPVYGLLIGNMLVVALCLLLRFHEPVALGSAQPDIHFVDQMGILMVWGTLLLFVDSLMIVLLYETLGRRLARWRTLRIVLAAAVVLSFDQLAFFSVLRLVTGVPMAALFGGWAAKMGAALVYGLMLGAYLRLFEDRGGEGQPRRLADLFDLLTYRHRHAALLRDAVRDAETGALAASHLGTIGAARFRRAVADGRPLGVMVLEVQGGIPPAALRATASALQSVLRIDDLVFRHGAARLTLLLDGLPAGAAEGIASRLRALAADRVAADPAAGGGRVRGAVAVGPAGMMSFADLLRRAEAGLIPPSGPMSPGPAEAASRPAG